MSPSLQTSIVVGAGSALATLTLAGGVAMWLAPVPQTVWTLLAGGAALIGILSGSAVMHLGQRFDRDRQKIADFSRTLLESPDAPMPSHLTRPSAKLAFVIAQSIETIAQQNSALITRTRELELQARVSEAERCNLEAILNAISDGVMVTDAFNEVTLANPSAARALRFDLLPSLHRPIDEVLDEPRLIKLIKDTREAGKSMRRSVEHRLSEQQVLQVTTAGIVSAQSPNGSGGVVTVMRDVTRDKEIAEMKSEFVSKVSHELRTPLSSIKAYVEMLIDGEAHDETTRAEFYSIVEGETDRLQRMIDNILSISQIESGVTKVNRRRFPLAVMARECVEVLRPQAEEKNIDLRLQALGADAEVFADRDMIYQATMNLLSNAIKYTPNGGSVSLDIVPEESERVVAISVTDDGLGIPAEDLSGLFQKFYRVASNNHMASGTGLGLNLVKHVIETVHSGRVSVKSVAGAGSTFTYQLQMADK